MDYSKSAFLIIGFVISVSCNSEKGKEVERCHPIKLKTYKAKTCSIFFDDGSLKEVDTWYLDSAGKPQAHGTAKWWHKNGQLKGVHKAKFGCPYDTSKGFFPDGSLESIIPYKNCEEHGIQKIYYENGQIKRLTPMKNGEQFGHVKMWHPNGQLSFHHIYDEHGNFVDKGFMWYEDGTLRAESVYKEDEWWEKRYYQNKQLKSEVYYENDLLVNAKYYDRKGYPMSEIKNGDGIHCYFNEEANKYSLRFYRGGKMVDQMFHSSCEPPEF